METMQQPRQQPRQPRQQQQQQHQQHQQQQQQHQQPQQQQQQQQQQPQQQQHQQQQQQQQGPMATTSPGPSPAAHPLDDVVRTRKQEIWYRIANLHESMCDHDAAIAALDKVLSLNPAHEPAITKAGVLFLFKSNYRQAARFLQRAIAHRPDNPSAWAALAHCYVMTDDLPTACRAYHSAISHHNATNTNRTDPAAIKAEPNAPGKAAAAHTSASSLTTQKLQSTTNPKIAKQHNNGHAANANATRGSGADNDNNNSSTGEAIRGGGGSDGGGGDGGGDLRDPLLWFGLANLYDRVGLLEKALDAFEAVLEMSPMHPLRLDIYCSLALIHKERRHYDAAQAYLRRITGEPATDAATLSNALFHMGHIHELRGESQHAIDAYSTALQHNPSHLKAHHHIAWLLHRAGNTDDAVHCLNRAVAASPNDAHTHYVMGRIAMTTKDYRTAYDSYRQAVYRDTKNPLFWCAIGVLYFHMQQHRDAMDAFSRAIHIDPNMPQVWHDMGILYEIYQQYPDAVDAYRRALSLTPGNADTSRRLAVAEQIIAGVHPIPPPPQLTPDSDGPPVSPGPESVVRPHLNPDVLSRFAPFPDPPRAPPPQPQQQKRALPPHQQQPPAVSGPQQHQPAHPQAHVNGIRSPTAAEQQHRIPPIQSHLQQQQQQQQHHQSLQQLQHHQHQRKIEQREHERVPASGALSGSNQPHHPQPLSNGPTPTDPAGHRATAHQHTNGASPLPPVSGVGPTDYHSRPTVPQQQQHPNAQLAHHQQLQQAQHQQQQPPHHHQQQQQRQHYPQQHQQSSALPSHQYPAQHQTAAYPQAHHQQQPQQQQQHEALPPIQRDVTAPHSSASQPSEHQQQQHQPMSSRPIPPISPSASSLERHSLLSKERSLPPPVSHRSPTRSTSVQDGPSAHNRLKSVSPRHSQHQQPHASGPVKTGLSLPNRPFPSLHPPPSSRQDAQETVSQRPHPSQRGNSMSPREPRPVAHGSNSPDRHADKKDWYRRPTDEEARASAPTRPLSSVHTSPEGAKHSSPYSPGRSHQGPGGRSFPERSRDEKPVQLPASQGERNNHLVSPRAREMQDARSAEPVGARGPSRFRPSPPRDIGTPAPETSADISKRSISSSLDGKILSDLGSGEPGPGKTTSPHNSSPSRGIAKPEDERHEPSLAGELGARNRTERPSGDGQLARRPPPGQQASAYHSPTDLRHHQPRRMRSPDIRQQQQQSPRSSRKGKQEVDEDMLPKLPPLPKPENSVGGGQNRVGPTSSVVSGSSRAGERISDGGSRSDAARDRDADQQGAAARSGASRSPHEQDANGHYDRPHSSNGRLHGGGHGQDDTRRLLNDDEGRSLRVSRTSEALSATHSGQGERSSGPAEPSRSTPLLGRDSSLGQRQRSPLSALRPGIGGTNDRDYSSNNGGPSSSLTMLRSVPMDRMLHRERDDSSIGRGGPGGERAEGHASHQGRDGGSERRTLPLPVSSGGGVNSNRDDLARSESRYDGYRSGHSRRNSFDSARALNGGGGSSGRGDEDRRKAYDYSPRAKSERRSRDGPVSPGRSRSTDRYSKEQHAAAPREHMEPMKRSSSSNTTDGSPATGRHEAHHGGNGEGCTGGSGSGNDQVPFGSGAPTSFSKSLSRTGASTGLSSAAGAGGDDNTGSGNGVGNGGGRTSPGSYKRHEDDERLRRAGGASPGGSRGNDSGGDSPRGRKRRYTTGARRYDETDSQEREREREQERRYGNKRMEAAGTRNGGDAIIGGTTTTTSTSSRGGGVGGGVQQQQKANGSATGPGSGSGSGVHSEGDGCVDGGRLHGAKRMRRSSADEAGTGTTNAPRMGAEEVKSVE